MDFPVSDPIEIIKRLMIGSEGTLGFVSRATYNTVPEWPNKVCIIASDAIKLPRDCLWCSGILCTMLSLLFCGRAIMLECRLQQGVLLEDQASAQEAALSPLAWL